MKLVFGAHLSGLALRTYPDSSGLSMESNAPGKLNGID